MVVQFFFFISIISKVSKNLEKAIVLLTSLIVLMMEGFKWVSYLSPSSPSPLSPSLPHSPFLSIASHLSSGMKELIPNFLFFGCLLSTWNFLTVDFSEEIPAVNRLLSGSLQLEMIWIQTRRSHPFSPSRSTRTAPLSLGGASHPLLHAQHHTAPLSRLASQVLYSLSLSLLNHMVSFSVIFIFI